MKRSKHHRPRPDERSASFPILLAKQVEPLPVVTPVKDKEFWKALLAPSSRNSTEISWTDFCRAMQRVGYVQIRQGGSGRRFEFKNGATGCATGGVPGAIVFHEPHANGGKVSHRNAQRNIGGSEGLNIGSK
ncbi:Beta-ketoacyl synthase [Metarhizium robertsii ARSEF 23]|uniref:Beta-ketoacyl synthase n=1 Tax=Metarhizium robertsii (strain ARSEF 23 / ATCC MYA-3075) TaxID=655844 RepID=A0A0B2XF46_METRA|nr:Beta-ketoacyl synthase [Metarhizium robertsii ARSEF 23]KHO10576.1 Beta-ketoacyl synthase [Metarhizium robertsii ARSEF 23]